MKTPLQQYQTNPVYHHLVRQFYQVLSLGEFDQTELRAAAELACKLFEETMGNETPNLLHIRKPGGAADFRVRRS